MKKFAIGANGVAMLKKLAVVFCVLMLLLPFVPNVPVSAANVQETRPFLRVSADGTTIERFLYRGGGEGEGSPSVIVIPAQWETSPGVWVDIKNISPGAFAGCLLTSITFEANSKIEIIGDNAFQNNQEMISIALPGSVTSLGNNVFQNCASLTSVTFEGSAIASIGTLGASSIQHIYIEQKVKGSVNGSPWGELNAYVHWQNITDPPVLCVDDSGLWKINTITREFVEYMGPSGSGVDLVVPHELYVLGLRYTFSSFPSGTFSSFANIPSDERVFNSVTISDGIITIADNAFSPVGNIGSLNLGNTVEAIGANAFSGKGLTEVVLPDSLKTIGNNAFSNNKLTGLITIPGRVTSVAANAFSNNPNITQISVLQYRDRAGDGEYDRNNNKYLASPNDVKFNAPWGANHLNATRMVYFMDEDDMPIVTWELIADPATNRVTIKITVIMSDGTAIYDIKSATGVPPLTDKKLSGNADPSTAEMIVTSNGTYVFDILYKSSGSRTYSVGVPVDLFKTLNYGANGATGTVPPGGTYVKGTVLTVPGKGSLVNAGMEFTGWNTAANGTGTSYPAGSSLTIGDTDVTLFAQWAVIRNYTVHYNLNYTGAPTAPPSKTGVTWTQTGLLPSPAPTRPGYTLAGWNTAANGTGTNVTATTAYRSLVANDTVMSVTLYAQWTAKQYTVNYNLNYTGAPTAPPSLRNVLWTQTGLLPSPAPTRAGHDLTGWNTAANGTGTNVTATTPYSSLVANDTVMSVTLYAQWTVKGSYTVNYNLNYTGSPTPPPSKTSVSWTQTGLLPSPAPTRDGYNLTGWNTAANGTGTNVTATTPYSSLVANDGITSVTLYAQWTVKTGYRVDYNLNYTESPAPPASKTGLSWTQTGLLPSTTPTRMGYELTGWNTAANGTGTNVTASTAYSSLVANDGITSVTLYAQWTVKDGYTINYNLNYTGSPTPPPSKTGIVWTQTDLIPSDPTRDGYNFTGWTTAANGTGVKVTSTTPYSSLVTNDSKTPITLYAQWTVKDGYTINYNLNYTGSPTPPTSRTVTWTQTGLLPSPAPIRQGFNLTGWNTAANGTGTVVTANTPYSSLVANDSIKSVTLYAQWTEKNDYVVNYNLNYTGAPNPPASRTGVRWTQTGLLPSPAPTRAGHDLTGWNTAANGTGTNVTATTPYSSLVANDGIMSVTLYAQWTVKGDYTVNYDLNYTGAPAPPSPKTSVTWTQTSLLPSNPIRPGHTLIGWNTAANGTGTAVTSSNAYSSLVANDTIKSVTLYAQWTIKSYTVNYNLNYTGAPTQPSKTNVTWTQTGLLPSPAPTRTGHELTGWNTAANGTGTAVTNSNAYSSLVANDNVMTVTLYAQWKVKDDYTVNYNLNYAGSTDPAPKTGVLWTQTGLIPTTNPTRNGYSFTGWNTAANGTGISVTSTTPYSTLAGNDDTKKTVTLYAQWGVSTYTVNYSLNYTGSPTPPPSLSDIVWTQIGLIPGSNPTRTGYTFAGWNTAANGTGTAVTNSNAYSSLVANDTVMSATLYAQWTEKSGYTVSYNLNYTGSPTPPPSLTNRSWTQTGLIPTSNPTRNGYNFAGWNTAANGTGTSATSTTPYSTLAGNVDTVMSVTLYAQWTEKTGYTVNYNLNYTGSPTPPPSLTNRSWTQTGLIPTSNPVRAGYTFTGWNTAANGTGTTATSSTPYSTLAVNDTVTIVTLYAQWTEKGGYTVNYNLNYTGSTAPAPKTGVTWTQTGLIPATNPTRTGYNFAGWNTLANGTGLNVTATTPYSALVTSDTTMSVTLYAQWGERPNYTVNYNLNYTGSPAPPPSKTNVSWTQTGLIPTSNPVRDGYTFTGWNTAANGTGTNVTAITPYSTLAGNDDTKMSVTLYAQWTEKNDFTVNYNLNYTGSTAPAPKTGVRWTQTGLLPSPAPTRTGYALTGWNTAANGTGIAVTATTPYSALVTNDTVKSVTLYAQWGDKVYTVNYNLNYTGSTPPPSKTNVRWTDTNLIPTTNPTRNGYSFTGWNTAANGTGISVTLTTPYSSLVANDNIMSVTLYAQWTAKTYTVNFNAGYTGAPTVASWQGGWDDVIPLPTPAARAGYTFTGWYTSATGGSLVTAGTRYRELVANDGVMSVTLYARWVEKNDYTVNYNLNYDNAGSQTPGPLNNVRWTQTNLLPSSDPKRDGYTFNGWFTAATGGTKVTATNAYSSLVANDTVKSVTLYAQWTIKTYTVNYNLNYAGSTTPDPLRNIVWTQIGLIPGADPKREGYTFNGWFTAASGGTKVTATNAYSSLVANDGVMFVTLYAQWTEKNDYVVSYNLNYTGAPTPPDSKTGVRWTQTNLLPSDPIRAEYIFQGWFTAASGGTKVTADNAYSSLVANDTVKSVTLYAQWKIVTYTVSYDVTTGKGAVAQDIVDSGSTCILKDRNSINITHDPVNGKDVVFYGWSLTKDDHIYSVAEECDTLIDRITNVRANTKVFAVWAYDTTGDGEPDPWKTPYTLVYDVNGGIEGSGPDDEVLAENAVHKLSTVVPEHDDADDGMAILFVGWTFEEPNKHARKIFSYNDFAVLPDMLGDDVLVKNDMTVYALWGYDEDGNGIPDVLEGKHLITIYCSSRSDEMISTTLRVLVLNGDTYAPVVPTVDGHVFVGWYEVGASVRAVPDKVFRDGEPRVHELSEDVDVYLVFGRDSGKTGDKPDEGEPDGIEDFDLTRSWQMDNGKKLRADEVVIWNSGDEFDISYKEGFKLPEGVQYVGYRISTASGTVEGYMGTVPVVIDVSRFSTVSTANKLATTLMYKGVPTYVVNPQDGDVVITYVFRNIENPQTSDTSNITLFLSALMISAISLAGVVVFKKKKRYAA